MAVARINEANTDAAWLKKATDQTYNILQVKSTSSVAIHSA